MWGSQWSLLAAQVQLARSERWQALWLHLWFNMCQTSCVILGITVISTIRNPISSFPGAKFPFVYISISGKLVTGNGYNKREPLLAHISKYINFISHPNLTASGNWTLFITRVGPFLIIIYIYTKHTSTASQSHCRLSKSETPYESRYRNTQKNPLNSESINLQCYDTSIWSVWHFPAKTVSCFVFHGNAPFKNSSYTYTYL